MMCQHQLTNKGKTTKDVYLALPLLNSIFIFEVKQTAARIRGETICRIFFPSSGIFVSFKIQRHLGPSVSDLEVRGFVAAFVREPARLSWVDGRPRSCAASGVRYRLCNDIRAARLGLACPASNARSVSLSARVAGSLGIWSRLRVRQRRCRSRARATRTGSSQFARVDGLRLAQFAPHCGALNGPEVGVDGACVFYRSYRRRRGATKRSPRVE
jgi:hypothetical protein